MVRVVELRNRILGEIIVGENSAAFAAVLP